MVKSGDKDRNRRSRHKNDQKDDGNDGNHWAKYSRSRDENRYHDGRKEGRSSRHRSRSRHRERDRDRGSRERKERDREDRKKDRERQRDWERDRHRDSRDRDRERQRERKRSRRSSNQSERHRWERDEKDRDRESREHWETRKRDRESRKKKEAVAEPVADPERDQRTLFAYMSKQAGDRDVFDFFSRAGKIRDIRIILDPYSRRSKGCGCIEFFDVESVPEAIALSGEPLLGQPVLVGRSTAEKNLVQSTDTITAGARTLSLGRLPVETTEDQLRQFVNPEDARNALNWDGLIKIAGGEIKLSKATDPAPPTTGLPSECLLLTNMFDPKEEAKADFDLDIKEDVEGECSKYGTLKHIHVDKNSPGLVYLRFDDTESAINARRTLHGRSYARKEITARFMVPRVYEAKFPDSK